MTTRTIDNIVKLAACICNQDGIISQTELNTMADKIHQFNEAINKNDFNGLIDDYFKEDKSVKEYCEKINISADIDKILSFCLESASSDGLDARENKAYQQACSLLKK